MAWPTVTDRVVEYPNRIRLVPVEGQTNVYNVELVPGLVTSEGTPLNKTLFDNIIAGLVTGGDTHAHTGNDGAILNHNTLNGLTTGDPHTQYLTSARGDAAYLRAGTSGDVIFTNYNLTGDVSISATSWVTNPGAIDPVQISAAAGDLILMLGGARFSTMASGTIWVGISTSGTLSTPPANDANVLYGASGVGNGNVYAIHAPASAGTYFAHFAAYNSAASANTLQAGTSKERYTRFTVIQIKRGR